MSEHPIIPIDQGAIEDVAARMDLRTPNKDALTRVAERFDSASGEPFEAVCDLATAVGKTYLAAAIIDYLANAGVRHFLIVTPGRTILSKTVANFTEGHPKSVLAGMEAKPLVVTAETFNTGAVASALDDPDQVILFVFNVQQLIRPTEKTARKTRKYQEWLGDTLYEFLRTCEDLVVISDEHHVYAEKAGSFSAAIRDLDATAVIGLTATPDKSDEDKIIFKYPLARAIAEKYVKTPVLVGRKDDRDDVETRLRDGVLLLDAKQKAIDLYCSATGERHVNAVMFVVADTIDNANKVAEVLRKPGLYEQDYEQRVLVVHSDAPDDALARLEAVEDPDSPVRVIVSVSMLKEGWDVKNIFVICSLRPSISDVLTEQTLGRGLRLPWGSYRDVELLDTVEVLSHERYEELLSRAGVLLEGLVAERTTVKPAPAPASESQPQTMGQPEGRSTDGTGAGNGGEQESPEQTTASAAGQPLAVTVMGQGADGAPEAQVVATTDPATGQVQVGSATGGSAATSGASAGGTKSAGEEDPEGTLTSELVLASMEARVAGAEQQVQSLSTQIHPRADVTVRIPEVDRRIVARSFSLSDLPDSKFSTLGAQLALVGGGSLQRKVLNVVADPTADTGYRLVPQPASDIIEASRPELPFGGVLSAIQNTILDRDYVTVDGVSVNAAKRLAQALVDGAGGEDKLVAHVNATLKAVILLLNKHYKAAPAQTQVFVTDAPFAPVRSNSRPEDPNRYGKFSPRAAYSGWAKSLHPLNWFDSSPERTFASLVDEDDHAAYWARIQRGERVIQTDAGKYSPDFYVRGSDGVNHLVEVKADRDVETQDVQTKRAAAEAWARLVTDYGTMGTWKYVFVPEAVLKVAKTWDSVLVQATQTS